MKNNSQIGYSRLTTQAVMAIIKAHYPVSDTINCEYYVTGLHDNYLIHDGQTKKILRVYRDSWRTETEICFELELLLYINKQHTGSPIVAAPLLTSDNKYCIAIDCPEARRYAALFPFAAGDAPMSAISNEQSKLLGETIATIHQLSSGFDTQHQRDQLNLAVLLDNSVNLLLDSLTKKQQSQLVKIQKSIHRNIPPIVFTPPFSCFCTGDVNATNFHINNNHITVFDFDQCGYGLRCFEIGKYFSYLLKIKNPQRIKALQQAFLTGYQSISEMENIELQAIPFYISVALIWVMAIHVNNVDLIGRQYLNKKFWDSRMSLLINSLPDELL